MTGKDLEIKHLIKNHSISVSWIVFTTMNAFSRFDVSAFLKLPSSVCAKLFNHQDSHTSTIVAGWFTG